MRFVHVRGVASTVADKMSGEVMKLVMLRFDERLHAEVAPAKPLEHRCSRLFRKNARSLNADKLSVIRNAANLLINLSRNARRAVFENIDYPARRKAQLNMIVGEKESELLLFEVVVAYPPRLLIDLLKARLHET